jgi:hypothetical protein
MNAAMVVINAYSAYANCHKAWESFTELRNAEKNPLPPISLVDKLNQDFFHVFLGAYIIAQTELDGEEEDLDNEQNKLDISKAERFYRKLWREILIAARGSNQFPYLQAIPIDPPGDKTTGPELPRAAVRLLNQELVVENRPISLKELTAKLASRTAQMPFIAMEQEEVEKKVEPEKKTSPLDSLPNPKTDKKAEEVKPPAKAGPVVAPTPEKNKSAEKVEPKANPVAPTPPKETKKKN